MVNEWEKNAFAFTSHTKSKERRKKKRWETNNEEKNIGAYDLTLNSLAERRAALLLYYQYNEYY